MVLTVHNLVGGTRRGLSAKVLRRAETYVVERCDHLIVISDEIDERFADVLPPERRTFILPVAPARSVQRSAPEVRASYGIAADAPLVTIVARHHPQKNLPMFLDAMRLVRDRLPEVRGLMVGDGPERGALEAHRHALGLDDTVVVAGMRPNPVDEMHAADVVALTSDWEGSPLVVAECLAVGRPLVTTAVGTVRRHLVDGENARIVAIGNPRAMADALVELLVDRSLADAIGAAGQRVAAAVFDADRLTAAVAAVYRDIPRRTSR
jgi:glycosyltransferase involved in cell wall biosynthesis